MTFQKTRLTQLAGLRVDQPAANTLTEGSLYFVTDEGVVERVSSGAAWVEVLDAGGALFTSRSVPYSSNSATFPDPAVLTSDPDNLAYRSDTFRFGINVANGNAQYPLDVSGTAVDIGYMIRAAPASGSCFTQMKAIGANDQAGFSFDQSTNGVEWRMAVVGNAGNYMRWQGVTGGGASTQTVLFVGPTSMNLLLASANTLDVTTGTRCLVLENGTAPTAAAANTVAIFSQDDAASAELCIINEADEITQLSGHMTLASGKLIRMGGATSSFPALKRASAVLEIRLADDSAYANLKAAELVISSGTVMMRSSAAMTNGAGANVGTLTNSPATGDPTKWIPFDDNGTTRHIPAW